MYDHTLVFIVGYILGNLNSPGFNINWREVFKIKMWEVVYHIVQTEQIPSIPFTAPVS